MNTRSKECKRRKVKCSGETPCYHCRRHEVQCLYSKHMSSRSGKLSYVHPSMRDGFLLLLTDWMQGDGGAQTTARDTPAACHLPRLSGEGSRTSCQYPGSCRVRLVALAPIGFGHADTFPFTYTAATAFGGPVVPQAEKRPEHWLQEFNAFTPQWHWGSFASRK